MFTCQNKKGNKVNNKDAMCCYEKNNHSTPHCLYQKANIISMEQLLEAEMRMSSVCGKFYL
eukprot:m.201230 g.201230  ORF g.201230 m.201230 type:complete len:61 (+) comp18798_c0_seq8:57-239(+)